MEISGPARGFVSLGRLFLFIWGVSSCMAPVQGERPYSLDAGLRRQGGCFVEMGCFVGRSYQ